MRQVITLGAHVMNQKDQISFLEVSSTSKKQTNRSSWEQNISNLLRNKSSQSPTETLKWYKKEKRPKKNKTKKKSLFVSFFFFTVKKLAQYLSERLLLCPSDSSFVAGELRLTDLRAENPEREDRRRDRNTERHGNRDVTVITHPARRGSDGQM